MHDNKIGFFSERSVEKHVCLTDLTDLAIRQSETTGFSYCREQWTY